MKIAGYIFAGFLIIFAFLFLLASFGEMFQAAWFIIGGLLLVAGLAIIWFLSRQKPAVPGSGGENVTINVDLPANVKLDTLKCQSCGGVLKPEDIKMVAGAPVVTCPYCKTTYQLTEEPKW